MNDRRATGIRRSAARAALAAALVALFFAGCHFPHKLRVTPCGDPFYSRVSLVYEVDAGRGALAPRFVERPPGEGMSFPRPASGPVESAVLRLEYPHPYGWPGMARVTVRFSRLSIHDRRNLAREKGLLVRLVSATEDWQRDAEYDPFAELYELSITRQELDLLLIDLAQSGYFDPNLRANGGTRLAVEIDGGTASKDWVPEPRLDDIITRLHAEGLAAP